MSRSAKKRAVNQVDGQVRAAAAAQKKVQNERTAALNNTRVDSMFRVPERFALLNKLITRDLNGT